MLLTYTYVDTNPRPEESFPLLVRLLGRPTLLYWNVLEAVCNCVTVHLDNVQTVHLDIVRTLYLDSVQTVHLEMVPTVHLEIVQIVY